MKFLVMYNCLKKRYKLLTVLFVFLTKSGLCQLPSEYIFNNVPMNLKSGLPMKKNKVGIEITASVLPKAKITREAGNYRLRSHLQSAFDAGINYIHDINQSLSISSGIHVVIGIRNFFANIPDNDIPGYPSEPPVIEDKDLWATVKIPLLIEKRIEIKKLKTIAFKIGLNIQYSGFMQDESIDGIVIDSNRTINIFNAELSVRNKNKPWITFLAGVSKPFILDNKNILSLGLLANISNNYFYEGTYIITIPNHTNTFGTYKISGTSLGLSVQYIFTGTNKRLIRSYQKNVL